MNDAPQLHLIKWFDESESTLPAEGEHPDKELIDFACAVSMDTVAHIAEREQEGQKGMKWVSPEIKLPNSCDEVLFKYKGFKYFGYYSSLEGSEFFSTTSGLCVHYTEVDEWLDESTPSAEGEKEAALQSFANWIDSLYPVHSGYEKIKINGAGLLQEYKSALEKEGKKI